MHLNSITNIELRCGTVETVFPQLVEEGVNPQIVIIDPPRKGVDRDALKCVAKLNPERIIYVSCNPATLARDLKILHESGYQTKSIRPVDLFPQTFHVESVSVLDRN
jgi:23S rRNA (uracil1939-C5)-methyltransferase